MNQTYRTVGASVTAQATTEPSIDNVDYNSLVAPGGTETVTVTYSHLFQEGLLNPTPPSEDTCGGSLDLASVWVEMVLYVNGVEVDANEKCVPGHETGLFTVNPYTETFELQYEVPDEEEVDVEVEAKFGNSGDFIDSETFSVNVDFDPPDPTYSGSVSVPSTVDAGVAFGVEYEVCCTGGDCARETAVLYIDGDHIDSTSVDLSEGECEVAGESSLVYHQDGTYQAELEVGGETVDASSFTVEGGDGGGGDPTECEGWTDWFYHKECCPAQPNIRLDNIPVVGGAFGRLGVVELPNMCFLIAAGVPIAVVLIPTVGEIVQVPMKTSSGVVQEGAGVASTAIETALENPMKIGGSFVLLYLALKLF